MEKTKGLTKEEVKTLTERGLVNYKSEVKTKSIGQIIMTNFLTPFNFLNLCLALAIFLVGSYKNLLFLGVVICNTLISTFQEIRSKLVIDKLSLLNETKAIVIRDGIEKQISIHDIVLGDILKLKAGNQIVTDCEILDGEILVNEALITGESESVIKKVNSELLSGSFVVSGKCYAKAVHVGADNYAAKISAEAKYLKKVNSEIMNFINKVIKYISISIIPIGTLLFMSQLKEAATFSDAVVSTVAALIGMIPEGLVLLSSTVLAISVIRLAKYNVLIQELFCIESLARVDTICLDKTGTITEGNMEVTKLVPLNGTLMSDITDALGLIGYHMENDTQTMEAIIKKYARKNDYKVVKKIPFSSQTKWSGICFEHESYVIGAPEMVLQNTSKIDKELKNYVNSNRVVILAKTKEKLNKNLTDKVIPMALIIINDRIRKEARATLEYFKEQGVNIKLISGDNPQTVAGIASKVGLENIKYVDMSTNSVDIANLVDEYNVFGRVNPKQKKEIILALKAKGHTVAMTGDGINDVLALKEADCSVVMNSGSDAARNVAQLVLLDSNFSSMPKVVAEGRRSINNIQRSSTLFLCKTIYATLLAIIFTFLGRSYPFVPIQLTLTSMVTIGIPSFILAFESNNDRINGKIFINVLKKSVPTALTIVANILMIMVLPSLIKISQDQISTLCVILTALTGFMLLYKISVPFNTLRRCLFGGLILLFIFETTMLKGLFSLTFLPFNLVIIAAILFMIAIMLFNMFSELFDKIAKKIKF